MTGAEFDEMEPCELFDDEDFGGFREDDDCDRDDGSPERCGECLLWGEHQCSRHADAYLAWCREQSERHDVVTALRALLALPDAHGSSAWRGLLTRAREVLGEMHEDADDGRAT